MESKAILRACLWILVVATPLIMVPVMTEGFETPKLAFVECVVSVLVGGFWLVGLREWRRVLCEPVTLALVGCLAAAGVSSWWSMDWRVSVFGIEASPAGLVTLACYFVVFVAARVFVETEEQAMKLLRATAVPVVVACGYAVAQFVGVDPLNWTGLLRPNGVVRPGSTLGHPNFLAAWLMVILPLLTCVKRPSLRLGLVAFATLIVVVAQSRGAWVALAVVLLIEVILSGKLAPRVWWLTLGALAMVPVTARAALGVTERWPFLHNLCERLSVVVSLESARLVYLRTAGWIFGEHAVVGSGLDTFQLAFEHARQPGYWLAEWAGSPQRAHNEIAQVAATGGLVGLAAVGLLIVATLKLLKRVKGERLGRMLTLALVGFGVTGLAGFTVVSVGVTGAIALGLAAGLDSRQRPVEKASWLSGVTKPGYARVALAVVTAVACLWFVTGYAGRRVICDLDVKRSRVSQLRGQATQAFLFAQAASMACPASVTALSEWGQATAKLYETRREARFLDLLVKIHVRLVQLQPQQAAHWYFLGIVASGAGQGEAARLAFAEATRLELNNPIYLAGAGVASLQTGEFERMAGFARRGELAYPGFSVFAWQSAQAAVGLARLAERDPTELRSARVACQRAIAGQEFSMQREHRAELEFSALQREWCQRLVDTQ